MSEDENPLLKVNLEQLRRVRAPRKTLPSPEHFVLTSELMDPGHVDQLLPDGCDCGCWVNSVDIGPGWI